MVRGSSYTAAFTRRQGDARGTLKEEAQTFCSSSERGSRATLAHTCTPGSKRKQGRGKRLAPHDALTSRLAKANPPALHTCPARGQTPHATHLQNAIKNIKRASEKFHSAAAASKVVSTAHTRKM